MIPKNYGKKLLVFQKKLAREPSLKFIKKLQEKFPKSEIYLVGGAVRDAVRGAKDQKDYDFVIRNIQSGDLKKFLSQYGTINLVGKIFGVYKFQPADSKLPVPVDIAFPRTEHAFGTGGYHDVKIKSNPKMPIEEDLGRRDFTINAIAWDLKNKKIIDPCNGLEDLAARKIKAVGEPRARFNEDYSRILRGLRFVCQFGFSPFGGKAGGWKFDKKTFDALRETMVHINDEREIDGKKERVLPYEVVAKEFIKAFYYHPQKAFDLYDQSNAFKMLIPEILEMKNCPQPPQFHSEGDVWQHTRLVLEKIESKDFKKQFGKNAKNAELVIAALFHDIGKPRTITLPKHNGNDRIRFNEHDVVGAEMAMKICKKLKLDSLPENSPFRIEPKRIKQLVERHMLLVESVVEKMRPGTIEKYFFSEDFPGENLLKLTFVDAMATVPLQGLPDLKNLYQMVERIEELRVKFETEAKLPPPLLSGFEIMEYFKLKPGPKIGELIAELRNAQLDAENPIKTKKEAFRFLGKNL